MSLNGVYYFYLPDFIEAYEGIKEWFDEHLDSVDTTYVSKVFNGTTYNIGIRILICDNDLALMFKFKFGEYLVTEQFLHEEFIQVIEGAKK